MITFFVLKHNLHFQLLVKSSVKGNHIFLTEHCCPFIKQGFPTFCVSSPAEECAKMLALPKMKLGVTSPASPPFLIENNENIKYFEKKRFFWHFGVYNDPHKPGLSYNKNLVLLWPCSNPASRTHTSG